MQKLFTVIFMLVLSNRVWAVADKPKFKRAIIEFTASVDGTPYLKPPKIELTGKKLAQFVAHFPTLGQGKKGFKPAGWNRRVAIQFQREDKTSIYVLVNYDSTLWTWDVQNGDFRPAGNLAKTLAELETQAKKASPAIGAP